MTEDDLGPHHRAAETKKRRTRERAINATLDLFAPENLRGRVPTIEQIAEEGGVGVATLYNHFNTKYELYLAALTQLFEPLIRPLATASKLGTYNPPNVRTEIISYIYNASVIVKRYQNLVAVYIQSYFEAGRYVLTDLRISKPIQEGLGIILTFGQKPFDCEFAADIYTIAYHLDMLLLVACGRGHGLEEPVDIARRVLAELLPSIQSNYDSKEFSAVGEQLNRLAQGRKE